jgi:hypothetical protein
MRGSSIKSIFSLHMHKKTKISFSILLFTVAFVAAGCVKRAVPSLPSIVPSEPKKTSWEDMTPTEVTEKLDFIPGSNLEMRQTVFGFGAKLADALAGNNKEGVRVVIIERFAPREVVNVSWSLKTKSESQDSKTAREEATKLKKSIPEPEMVDTILTGNVKNFDLKNATMLYVPAFWPMKDEAPSFGSSGIWLPNDVFDSLSKNRVATLDFGLLDQALQGIFGESSEFKNGFANLVKEMKKIENRTDVYKIDGEKDLVDWPIKVNGKNVKVQVIKAKSWFGEIVVLNNSQNPLVLKLTLNPIIAGISGLVGDQKSLGSLVGYEVTGLNDVFE